MSVDMPVTEHAVKTERHTTFYLAAGPANGPLVIFVHGWPELAISWRHQLPALAALGFRTIAPDMRGYGRSSVYSQPADYAQEHIVRDMLELLDALGREKAVWVGHDWGSPVVWNLASHHPDSCQAVASLCVPYYTLERGLDQLLALVDRAVYPPDEYPAGQWDYMLYYEENVAEAIAPFDANVTQSLKLLLRKGDPAGESKPAPTATARRRHSLFGWSTHPVPDVPLDTDVLTEEALSGYASALERNGYYAPACWYLNHAANAEYAGTAQHGGYLDLPVLFLSARYDPVTASAHSRAAEAMRTYCRRLTEATFSAGHWLAQEKPVEVNAALVQWLATSVPQVWPQPQ
jgi:soluble epoxide hydrolase / lipid-phosphate phosphatase